MASRRRSPLWGRRRHRTHHRRAVPGAPEKSGGSISEVGMELVTTGSGERAGEI